MLGFFCFVLLYNILVFNCALYLIVFVVVLLRVCVCVCVCVECVKSCWIVAPDPPFQPISFEARDLQERTQAAEAGREGSTWMCVVHACVCVCVCV